MIRNLTFILLVVLASCSSSKKSADSNTSAGASAETVAVEAVADDNPTPTQEPASKEVSEESAWQERDPMMLPDQEKRINVSEYDAYYCDYHIISRQLAPEATEIVLPTSTGMISFSIENSNTMSAELAAKFPNIRSFKGKSKDGKLTLRLDTNDEGLFAEITGTGRKELIAPLFKGSPSYYAVYEEKNSSGGTPRDDTYD